MSIGVRWTEPQRVCADRSSADAASPAFLRRLLLNENKPAVARWLAVSRDPRRMCEHVTLHDPVTGTTYSSPALIAEGGNGFVYVLYSPEARRVFFRARARPRE